MRQAVHSTETKEQAVSGIVLGTLAALGGKTLRWSNNASAEHLRGLCVTALVRGTFDFCIGEGPSGPLLPPPSWLALGRGRISPGAAAVGGHSSRLGGCWRNWKLAL